MRVQYTYDQVLAAYDNWVKSRRWIEGQDKDFLFRVNAWELYCDVRDGLVIGTTKERRVKRERSMLVAIEGGKR